MHVVACIYNLLPVSTTTVDNAYMEVGGRAAEFTRGRQGIDEQAELLCTLTGMTKLKCTTPTMSWSKTLSLPGEKIILSSLFCALYGPPTMSCMIQTVRPWSRGCKVNIMQ